jgi:hypothetical protein
VAKVILGIEKALTRSPQVKASVFSTTDDENLKNFLTHLTILSYKAV